MKMRLIAVATHKFVTTPAEDLRTYELRKGSEVAMIIHNFADRRDRRSFLYHDADGRMLDRRTSPDFNGFPEVLVMIKDLLYTTYYVTRTKKRWDVFVAIDSLNFMAGFMLRRMRKIRTLVY